VLQYCKNVRKVW